jgi:catalase
VVQAYSFELGKCTYDHIKERMLYILAQIDESLAAKVSVNLGMEIPEKVDQPLNQAIGADADVEKQQPGPAKNYLDKSKALSQEFLPSEGIATRKIAVLAGDGFSESDYNKIKKPLEDAGAMVQIVGVHGGTIKCDKGDSHKVAHALMTTESVVFDALYIPGGKKSIDALMKQAKTKKFINEALKHCKAIALDSEAEELFDATYGKDFKDDEAVCINESPQKFIKAISKHRNWKREKAAMEIPA